MPAASPAQAFDTIMQITSGHSVARSLHVVAELGVADALDDSPRTSAELAKKTGTNPEALGRVLRLLASFGIFEVQDGRISHTLASRLLRTDHPQSMRSFVRMIGLPVTWDAYGKLDHSLKTGQPSVPNVYPGGIWKYFEENTDASRIFDQAMAAKAQGQIPFIVKSYDFSKFGRIADIAGGQGHLLQAILAANPKVKGVLFDLPHVIEKVSGAASERLQLQSGDFFKDKLPVCDAYLMMDIIHDWNDENSAKILKNLRRATPANAKLLLIEAIIPDDSKPNPAKVLDVHMLVFAGGRQRTQQEHAEMLAAAGFRFEREIDVGGSFSILEAVAV